MDSKINFKELYEVLLKTTCPMEVGDRKFEAGEVVVSLDKVLLGTFQEDKDFTIARGGADNLPRVWWEESKELAITLSQGVFSLPQLAILTGAKLVSADEPIVLSKREKIETDENNQATLKYQPLSYFCYDANTGEKLDYTIEGQTMIGDAPYRELIVDYQYKYQGEAQNLTVGRPLTRGYLSLEGRLKVKDDRLGRITTGIVKIPKIRLMSELSLRLGKEGTPLLGTVRATAYPDGPRGERKLMELFFLDEDLDSDI